MNNRFVHHLKITLITFDFVAINIIFSLGWFVFTSDFLIAHSVAYTYFGLFINLAWFVSSLIGNIYHSRNIVSFEYFTRFSAYAFFYFIGFVVLYLFFLHQFLISRIFIGFVLFGVPAALLFNRFLYLAIHKYFKHKDHLISKVVVIGYNKLSKKVVKYLEADGVNKEILGYCEEYKNVKELSHYPILCEVKNAIEVCKTLGATEIYSTIAPEQQPVIYDLMQSADKNCIRFKIVPDISIYVKKKVHLDFLHEIPVISMRAEPLEDLGNRIKKRGADIMVSSIVILVFLSWMIPIIGLLIWLESRGPIFFKQARSGKDNKSFSCLKFRSMTVNTLANDEQASRDDKRITKIGKFLRRTSLDEFPQFLNVLKGQMSIVGPRPHMLKHTDEYSRQINQYMIRHFMKPGITGWAQVNGYRGETNTLFQMQKRVEYDLWYLEHWNILFDLKIVFMTAFNTIKGDKNAF